jgi:hypothetical protein
MLALTVPVGIFAAGLVIDWLWLKTESIRIVSLAHGALNNWGQYAFKYMQFGKAQRWSAAAPDRWPFLSSERFCSCSARKLSGESSPRLDCLESQFTRYDNVQQVKERTMKRTACVAIFVSGLSIGAVIVVGWPARVVEAQAAWQCRSWTVDEKGDVGAVGTWLGTARSEDIHLSTAGLSAGSRYAVVACKR